MSITQTLYQLQEIDSTWEKVRRRLLQLQGLAEGSSELKSARDKVEATQETLQTWQRTQKDAELESRSLGEKIRESEQRLMSGQVRNPKELELLQSSIESMQRHKSSVEDRGVEALLNLEELNNTLSQQTDQLSLLESEWQSKQQSIEAELHQRKREFVYLKRLREQATEKLSASDLEQYEHLRKRKAGIAVAKIEKDSCGACHIQVPTGVIGDARRDGSLTYCPGCGRILHAG